MPNYKPFFVTEAERKHVRRRARFQQHRGDASCHLVFFSLQGTVPKEIHAIIAETLGEHAPSYATVKNWVTQFKRGDFSTCVVRRPSRPKTVNTPKIIDQIHELIWEDRRISVKSIAEQQGISYLFYSFIYKIFQYISGTVRDTCQERERERVCECARMHQMSSEQTNVLSTSNLRAIVTYNL